MSRATLRGLFPTRGRPDRSALTVSRAALVALLAGVGLARAVGVEIPLRAQLVAYVVGMVAMNLPHGGYEHLDNLRRRALAFQARYLALYLGLIGAFVALLFVAPVVGLSLCLAVAVAKGGHGGLRVLDATTGTAHLRSRLQRALAAFVRGGAVMMVPIAAFPETFHAFSALMVNIFETGGLAAVAPYFDVTRPLIGGTWLGAAAVHVGLGSLRAGPDAVGSWRIDAGETLLLGAYFAVVPVVLAVGLYFPLWYSTRQVARVAAVETEPFDEPGDGLLGSLDADDPRVVALGSWGVLVGGALATGGLAAALFVLAPNPLGGAGPLAGAVAFWSVFVSVIALPHVVVGAWADRERGIWYVP